MKPVDHGKISAKRFGGVPGDYQKIHDFIDQTKMCFPDMRHRAILHNSFGCYLVEQMFGVELKNSAGRSFSPRAIAEQHIIDDIGFIPTVGDFLELLPMQEWFGGGGKTRTSKKIKLDGIEIVD